MKYLALVRHAESEWNKLGKWTGHADVGLSPEGILQARETGRALSDITFESVHTSALARAIRTCEEMQMLWDTFIEPARNSALNERDYGIYTGKNKWEVRDTYGEEAFYALRRGWNTPVPEGETLKEVHDRAVPYFQQEVEPHMGAKNILIVSHGNTLRALIKYLEGISDEDVSKIDIRTGEAHIYEINEGVLGQKTVRARNPNSH